MAKVIIPLFCLFLVVGCATYSDQPANFILQPGLKRSHFERAWGLPDRTLMSSGEETTSANWGTRGGEFYKGKRAYETWIYEQRGVTLFFHKKRLVNWKTDKSVYQLNEFSRPRP